MQKKQNSASVINKAQDLLKQSRHSSYNKTSKTTKASSDAGSELNAYLSQLSRKTSGTPIKKTTTIDGLSDLSLTTDDDDADTGVLQSRFFKKGLSQTLIDTDDKVKTSSKTKPAGNLNKTLPSHSSTALEKAAAFTAKYGSKKKAAKVVPEVNNLLNSSNSEPEQNETSEKPDKDVVNKVKSKYTQKTKVNTSTPKKKETKPKFHSTAFSDSDDEMRAFIMKLSPVTSPDIPPIRKQKTQLKDVVEVNEKEEKKKDQSPYFNNKGLAEKESHGRSLEKPNLKSEQKIEDEVSIVSSIHTVNESSDGIVEELQIDRSEGVFNKFGVQTIDDLNLQTIGNINPQMTNNQNFNTVDNLQTIDDLELQTVDDLRLQLVDNLKTDSYASDFETDASTDKTFSEIKTERESSEIKEEFKNYSYTESFIKSSKEKSASKSSSSTQTSRKYNSIQSKVSKHREDGSYIYTEEFDSYSKESGTDSEVEDLPKDSSRSDVYSRSYTSYSESTLTITPRKSKQKATVIDVGTQVEDSAFHGQRNAYAGIPGLTPVLSGAFMDPKLVTSHVISQDALEALTSYSPSVLAMNDLLRAQILSTQTAIQHMQHVHEQMVQSISEDYQYTTLEQTKEFIRRHRKTKITMEDALRQVKDGMNEGHR